MQKQERKSALLKSKRSDVHAKCPFCGEFKSLRLSHAIPKAAFMSMMSAGSGSAIGIPKGEGNAHLTSDTGDAPLLCGSCESEFNQNFDAPSTNAFKELENKIIADGLKATVEFDANQLAHAIVAIAWRSCLSPARMYNEVRISLQHLRELDTLMRLPTSEILRHCTVKISRLSHATSEGEGGFGQSTMREFVKSPEVYSIRAKRTGRFDRFAIDWTMFGFLVVLIVPKLSYPKSRNFGGLKRGETQFGAKPVGILDYPPMRDAIVAGYAKHVQGEISPGLKKRAALRDKERPPKGQS